MKLENIRLYKNTQELYLGVDTKYNKETNTWDDIKVINTYGWSWSFDSELYFQCKVEMITIVDEEQKYPDGWYEYIVIKDGSTMPFTTDDDKLKVYEYLEKRYKKHFDYLGYAYGRWNEFNGYTKGEKSDKFIKCK